MINPINFSLVWTLNSENIQPVGNSTPKSPVRSEEQYWLSLPDYSGTDIADWNTPEVLQPEEYEIDGLQENLERSANVLSRIAKVGSESSFHNNITPEEESTAIITPTRPSTAASFDQKQSKTPSFLESKIRTRGPISVLKNSSLNGSNKADSIELTGNSIHTQSWDLRMNNASLTSINSKQIPSLFDQEGSISGDSGKSLTGGKKASVSSFNSTKYINLPPSKTIQSKENDNIRNSEEIDSCTKEICIQTENSNF